MITTGYLRQMAREFLWKLVDHEKMEYDDIRYVKGNGGVFPHRIVKHRNATTGLEEVKKTPYLPESDTFILFDIVPLDNVANEPENDKITSGWNFNLIIHIYGRDADYISQRIRAFLQVYSVKEWIRDQNINIREIPPTSDILDGFENQQWWIRRKITLEMVISQIINIDEDLIEQDLENIELNLKKAG